MGRGEGLCGLKCGAREVLRSRNIFVAGGSRLAQNEQVTPYPGHDSRPVDQRFGGLPVVQNGTQFLAALGA